MFFKELLLFSWFHGLFCFYYPTAVREGVAVKAYLVGDVGDRAIKSCPVSDPSNCEVIVDYKRLSYPISISSDYFRPGNVAVERVNGRNVAIILSDRGKNWDYNVAIHRCLLDSTEPCEVIVSEADFDFHDVPQVEVVMENEAVKGYAIQSLYGSLLCEPDEMSDLGYVCRNSCLDEVNNGWGVDVQYSDSGLTPEYYAVAVRGDTSTNDRGIFRCAADFSGCECLFSCSSGGTLYGVVVEYGTDGAPSAYVYTDGGSLSNIYRCPLSGSDCEIVAGISSPTSDYSGFNVPCDVEIEPDSTGAVAAWIVVDYGNKRVVRCPVGASTCDLISTFSRPVGVSLLWEDWTTTTTTTMTGTSTTTTSTSTISTTSTSTSTATSTSSTSTTVTTTTSSATTSSTTTISSTSSTRTTTTTTTSTSSATSSSTTTATTTTTSTTSFTSTSTTLTVSSTTSSTTSTSTSTSSTSSTTSATTTRTASERTSTITSSSTTTTTTATRELVFTTFLADSAPYPHLTSTSAPTLPSTRGATTTTTATATATATTTTTADAADAAREDDEEDEEEEANFTNESFTIGTAFTTTTQSDVLLTTSFLSSLGDVVIEEVEGHLLDTFDTSELQVARSGGTVAKHTAGGDAVVICSISVADCGQTTADEDGGVVSSALVTMPTSLSSTFDASAVILIASLPSTAIPTLPTRTSLRSRTSTPNSAADAEETVVGEDQDATLTLVTEVASIQTLDESGAAYNVSGLEDPIRIGIRISNHPSSMLEGTLICAYWNSQLATWATDGVTFVEVTDDGYVWCDSSHLTVFAVFEDLIDPTAEPTAAIENPLCTTLKIATLDASQSVWTTGSWYSKSPAILFFISLGLLWVLVAISIGIDVNRFFLWSDEFYFEATGAFDTGVESRVSRESTEEFRHQGPLYLCPCISRRNVGNRIPSLRSLSDASSNGIVSTSFDCDGFQANHIVAKESLPATASKIIIRHWIRANIGYETIVDATTLETIGLGTTDNGHTLQRKNLYWRRGMSPEFVDRQRNIARRMPQVMARVCKDGRCWAFCKLFLYWHPLFDMVCLDVRAPAARKALALANSLLGNIFFTLIFLSFSDSLLSAASSVSCTISVDMLGVVFVALASSFAAAIPPYLSVKVSQRRFYQGQDYSSRQKARLLFCWSVLNGLAWLCDLLYSSALAVHIATVVANLHDSARGAWWALFVTIFFRWLLLMPFTVAMIEALIVRFLRKRHPNFFQELVERSLPTGRKNKGTMPLPSVEKEWTEVTYDNGDISQSVDVDVDADILAETFRSASPPVVSKVSSSADKRADAARWQRAVSAQEVLEFYVRLPEIMPEFDPYSSTIADVTRLAILPLTRSRETLVLQIAGISNEQTLADISAGFPGTLACRFGEEEAPQAPTITFEENKWSLETEIDWLGEDLQISVTIFKATTDFITEIARADIPAYCLLQLGEVQVVPLILAGTDKHTGCDLMFTLTEVVPTLENLFQRFHEPILPANSGRGKTYAEWVAEGEQRTPEAWIASSAPGTRFSSLVAAVAADAIGFWSYEIMLTKLLDPGSQQELSEGLQGEHGWKLYWITCFCEALPHDDVTANIEIDRARLFFWTTACMVRGVPQIVLIDHMEHFRPDISFFHEVLEANNLGVYQKMLAPTPDALTHFFELVERIPCMGKSQDLRSMFQGIQAGIKLLEKQHTIEPVEDEPEVEEPQVQQDHYRPTVLL